MSDSIPASKPGPSAETPAKTEPNTPEGFQFFSENTAKILFKDASEVFYNPVQEFNRDLSILMIRQFKSMLEKEGKDHKISIMEALSATGLRSIRYAKEIQGVDHIIANDIEPAAVESIQRNSVFNGVDHIVRPNLGDATVVMYANRGETKFDVVDLDPYGSPAPFLEGAVQCVKDGGLLCVTATDMAVLCGSHPSTCHNKYGSLPAKSKGSCHEMGLRILMQAISAHAARYKRYIVPLLSISVDFYCRLFVRVYTSANECKLNPTKLGYVSICNGCESYATHPMARVTKGSQTVAAAILPPAGVSLCDNCGRNMQFGGPLWLSPIFSPPLLSDILKHLDDHAALYNTSKRLYGLLSVMCDELHDIPLFMTVPNMCNAIHVTQPTLISMRSAVIAQGYKVSGSHTEATALKSNAPSDVLWDIIRCWNKLHPSKNASPTAPAHTILSREPKVIADFKERPDALITRKVPRFLPNPRENWGPLARATGKKRDNKEADLKTPHEALLDKRMKNQGKRSKKDKEVVNVDRSTLPCKYFAQGKCHRGEKCIYSHGITPTAAPAVDSTATPMELSETTKTEATPNNVQ